MSSFVSTQFLVLNLGFIKTTHHRPTEHRTTDPPTSYHLSRKIGGNRKEKALTKLELHHRYAPWKLLRFLTVIFIGAFQKFISTDTKIFNISYKVTSMIIYKSSHRRCSVRKGFLRNCAKVTGKYLCQSLYFNKVGSATLLK